MTPDPHLLGHWWVPNDASLADVQRSADLARETTGRRQMIHRHAHGDDCTDACAIREPQR